MKIKTGCDLVHIGRFRQSAENGGEKFFETLFSPHELTHASSIESRAGMFAAKEAVIKALELKVGDWKKIEIVKNKAGRPEIKLHENSKEIFSFDISISHDGEYAVAVAAFLIKS